MGWGRFWKKKSKINNRGWAREKERVREDYKKVECGSVSLMNKERKKLRK